MKIPLNYGINKVGLPLIVTSSKPNLCFLIDTGATHNIVFSYVYDELMQYFSVLGEPHRIIGIEGNNKDAFQVRATIAFECYETTAEFSVIEATEAIGHVQNESGIQIHGILGVPFLVQNKWILDFDKLILQR